MDDPGDVALLGLLRRCREDHRAWINGDGSSYGLEGDGTIMGAIGGHGRGGPEILQRQVATAARWASGEGTVEFVNGGVASDIAWLAMIERASVTIAGQPRTGQGSLPAVADRPRQASGSRFSFCSLGVVRRGER